MPNLNYAELWQSDLLEILNQGCLTAPFITPDVKWLSARTFHFTQMSVSGYNAHSRDGGFKRGTYAQQDVPYTVEHSRDVEFFVDKANVADTNGTADAHKISVVFEKTQAAPETDAYFFHKIYDYASKNNLTADVALTEYTVANVFTKLKAILKQGKLRRYRQRGTLLMYVNSDIMDLLERSTEIAKKVELTALDENDLGIKTRVSSIDGVPIIEVIDVDRFRSSFNFESAEGGFEPAAGSKAINVCVVCTETCVTVPRINSIYFFAPGAHTQGDGWLYQNRADWDTFVFPNGLDGKIDSIYVECDTTTTA